MTENLSSGYVDTHCHLNFDEFSQDIRQVIERAREHGIIRILVPGIDLETSRSAIQYAQEYEFVYAAVGVHPNNGLSWADDTLEELKQLAGNKKVVAIGEIGLDYYRDYTPKDLQRTILTEQLELAGELGLPVIVHNRLASEDICEILSGWQQGLNRRGSKLAERPGVLHAFSEGIGFAEAMVARNYKLGIGGAVTFHNSVELQTVVGDLPLQAMLLETDSPYLSPHPLRGKRNEPTNVRIVSEKIAELKSILLEDVVRTTTGEANKLFNWRDAR